MLVVGQARGGYGLEKDGSVTGAEKRSVPGYVLTTKPTGSANGSDMGEREGGKSRKLPKLLA